MQPTGGLRVTHLLDGLLRSVFQMRLHLAFRAATFASLCATAALSSSARADEPATSSAPASASSVNPNANFAFSKERWHSDSKIGWDGFLSGLRGFEHFYEPVGQPIYFESPFNNTGVRFLYLHHEFSDKSQLQGGNVDVAAVQARVALTERLGFIATKDGYSWLDANALPKEEGWNAIAAGLKYAVYVDRDIDLVITPGFRLMLQSGEWKVLQSNPAEISPFLSIAKGWGKFHMIGDATFRLPFDDDDGNSIFQWDLHADYDLIGGFAPCIEVHGLHYLSNGNKVPFKVGGLDYANIGSADVDGSTVVWMGLGGRWKFNPHLSVGGTYEFALTNKNADIMDKRVTLDLQFVY